jgi:hypothetical protein
MRGAPNPAFFVNFSCGFRDAHDDLSNYCPRRPISAERPNSLQEDNMNRFKRTLALSFLGASAFAFTAQSAFSADFPKSGGNKGVIYLTAAVTDQLEGWEAPLQPGIFVMTGVLRTEAPDSGFDKSFVRCVGERALLSGKYASSGTCTQTAADGDKVFSAFQVGQSTFVGGTGKFKGITGVSTLTAERIYQGKDDFAIIMSFEGTYEIK